MRIQGIKIGVTMAVLVFALLTVNTLSAATGVGVELTSSGVTTDQVESTAGEFQEPSVTGVGSQDPGFFGVAVGVTRTFQQLIAFTTGIDNTLISWGLPWVIGYSVQAIVDLTMGIAVLQIILRFKA